MPVVFIVRVLGADRHAADGKETVLLVLADQFPPAKNNTEARGPGFIAWLCLPGLMGE